MRLPKDLWTGKESLLTADNCISGLSSFVNFDPFPSFCCAFFSFFNSLFSFDFGVIPVYVLFCCFEFWRQNDDKPEIQLSAVNSDCFPVLCGLEGRFGACIRQILIRFTCDSYIFA